MIVLLEKLGLPTVALFTLALLVHALAAINVWHMSTDMLYGDSSEGQLLVSPRYRPMRMPDSELATRYLAERRIAADFAQVYFPVQTPTISAWSTETSDPFGRSSRLTPFFHSVCAWTICRLDYGPASLAHITIQYLLFMVSFVYAFIKLNIRQHVLLGVVIVNACLFLTPVGLSWFERGQFSLYVACAYLWLLLGLIRRSPVIVIISAVFACIKLTALPFMFVAFGCWVLALRDRQSIHRGIQLAAAFVATATLLLFIQFEDAILFFAPALAQEYRGSAEGLSLTGIIPLPLVKALPFLLLAIGVPVMRRCGTNIHCAFPFLLGCAIILSLYPTKSFDYSVPCLLGLVPIVLSCIYAGGRSGRMDAMWVAWGFVIFLGVSSYSNGAWIGDPASLKMIFIYLVFSLSFMLISVTGRYIPCRRLERKHP